MGTSARPRPHRPAAVMRGSGDERVVPLELFFDLVFVLAVTQCTALMSQHLTAKGMVEGLLVLGVLWWSWVGYAWLTSVVDPEEGAVLLAVFRATGALVVGALCVPDVFGSMAGVFAGAYAAVRGGHIALFLVASREDPALRQSVLGLAVGSAIGVGLLAAAAFTDGALQIGLWAVALALDAAEPYFFGAEGWKLVPRHFSERHGLIILIAIGESIVAIGVGSDVGVDAGVVAAALLGTIVAAALFLLYFDVVALVAARRLEHAAEGRERNEVARDAFSYLHFPMVAGIVLVALGIERTIARVGHALHAVPAVALLGGAALYLLAHVAFRWRTVRRLSGQRLVAAGACLVLLPVALAAAALATLALLAALLAGLVLYERVRFAELRDRLRHQPAEAA